jgi:hypothetical protein
MQNNPYKLSELIDRAYQTISKYLDSEPESRDYKGLNYKQCINILYEKTLLSVASQFHVLFPSHYYKAMYVIDNVLETETILGWLEHNHRICLIDIGCGAGAASAAFIDTVHTLALEGRLNNDINICCIGVDVNPYALGLYGKFLTEIKESLKTSRLSIDIHLIREGLPQIETIVQVLENKREEWGQPRISQLLVMQMNIVDPLSGLHYERGKAQNILGEFGFALSEGEVIFGKREARAYGQLLHESKIDCLNIITVGTDNYDENKYPLPYRVDEMSQAISQHAEKNGHTQKLIPVSQHTVIYENPLGSYFRTRKNVNHNSQFYAAINFITNKDLLDDKRWQDILSVDNLQLAWVRARQNLMRESLFDETELRLFEQNLEANLARLSRQLANYMEILIEDETIFYDTPKSSEKSRPRGLTRLEEEIVAAAAIQDISKELSARYPRSYAYRINSPRSRGNEYLYQYWFDLYRKYIKDAQEAAVKYEDTAVVVQTDIKGFYEKIIQQRLIDIAND